MKKILNLLFVAAAVLLFASSCGKTGAVGPQGATGATGAVGPAGPSGANGANGSVIYAGTTDPTETTGAVGDFYLNKTSGMLFGPKTASGWGTGFSLVGPAGATGATGATGAAGNTVLSGTTIPAASLGKVGDFYLDITNYMLYGPKVASGWGTAVSLQGSAEVQYSGWNFASNPRDTTFDSSNWSIENLSAPALTQDILDKGAIEVYVLFTGNVYLLPYSSNAGGVFNTLNFWPRVGSIIINRVTTSNTYIGFNGNLEFRYVIIPGGKALAIKNHVDLTDYNAVRKFYKISD